MNTELQTLIRYFLNKLKKKLENQKVNEIDPFLEDFFTQSELIAIVQWLYKSKDLKDMPLETMKRYELLDMIGDTFFILEYVIHKWEVYKDSKEQLSPKEVWNVLEQLGLQTHYLGEKAIAYWDEYDHSNYRSLQLKSGRLQRVYGIYDALVTQEDAHKVDSQPKRFYQTKELAEEALEECIANKQFKRDEIHILETFKST